jgi:hypothetical protein
VNSSLYLAYILCSAKMLNRNAFTFLVDLAYLPSYQHCLKLIAGFMVFVSLRLIRLFRKARCTN